MLPLCNLLILSTNLLVGPREALFLCVCVHIVYTVAHLRSVNVGDGQMTFLCVCVSICLSGGVTEATFFECEHSFVPTLRRVGSTSCLHTRCPVARGNTR